MVRVSPKAFASQLVAASAQMSELQTEMASRSRSIFELASKSE